MPGGNPLVGRGSVSSSGHTSLVRDGGTMPLIEEPERWTGERLRPMLAEFHGELVEIANSFDGPPRGPVLDALGMLTARGLASAAAELAEAAQMDGLPLRFQVAAVNVAYEAVVASIDLMKSHTAGPKVPSRRPPSSAPPP
ncbi:MAG: hypothetical protein L3K15_00340 [Thermoplasmata archaeon]|nr:hypothetical protein [Thermoplasmata archaeon]